MEMQMDRLRDDFSEEWETCETENLVIRHFKVPQEYDFCTPRENLNGGNWLKPSKENLNQFTAVPWFFAKNLYKKHKIPIGLINNAWGGTPVESWMSCEALSDFPAKIADGRQYADTVKREETAKKNQSDIQEWESNLSRDDIGFTKNWQNPDTDISDWNEITLPGDFADEKEKTKELASFCGVIWLVKEFEASESFASNDAKVWLGTIVDADTVYINGVEVGNTGYRYPPRKYIPSGLVKQGKNRIVIRVVCVNGEGGVTKDKPFKIFTDNESAELSGNWKYKIGAVTSARPEEIFFQRQPIGNYNAMAAPLLKYPLKGVIWYQGESNGTNAGEYAQLFKLMIKDWRKNNNNEKLPFLFVQLPIWLNPSDNSENQSWPIIREAQKSALELSVTGMACALELGEWNDIHPINKKDVGYRLFLSADKLLFGADNSSPGAMFREFKKQQEKIIISFNNCANGLKSISDNAYVSVIGSEGQFRLPAHITGKDEISIDISSVKYPKKILYAWADNPKDRQLFNSDNLPVIPFRIEIS